jgi:DNA-binding winged helix-turn-helix (wHTH) protein
MIPIPHARALKYRFGPFELDPREGSLSRNGSRVRLQDLPYRLLVMLVERGGEVVSREEVRQRLWPENTFVEFDNSLGVAIRKVRESLGDDAAVPHYVETIPRRGYRFIAPVRTDGPAMLPPAVETEVPVPSQRAERSRHGKVVFVVIELVGALVLAG